MRPRSQRAIANIRGLTTALCLGILSAGCGGGGSENVPTAPGPAFTTLILDFEYVEVIEDCDGIEGDGDFQFAVVARSQEFQIDVAFDEDISLPPGGKTRAIGRRSYAIDAIDGKLISVDFNASELDKTIIGEEYNDDRLDFASASVEHEFRNGTWSNLGPRSITLGGPGCLVRLRYIAGDTPSSAQEIS